MFSYFRNRRRAKLLAEPFPPWWEAVLVRNVGHYPRLSKAEQAKLRDITRILIAEKEWEGCNGVHVTEEMKLTVAAQASLLLIGIDHDYYARVPSVVVYPSGFQTPTAEDDWEDDGLSDDYKSGIAVDRGPVIVAWDDVLAEGKDPSAGYNVVVHEFAHQLDFCDDLHNGTPPLTEPAAIARWGRVMTAALADHRREVEADADLFFSEDAAESEVEFFADAAEAFYCRPADVREMFPEVYALFADYFRVDPVKWFPGE